MPNSKNIQKHMPNIPVKGPVDPFAMSREVKMEQAKQKIMPKIIAGRKVVAIHTGMGRVLYYDAATAQRTMASPEEVVATLKVTSAGEAAIRQGASLADLLSQRYVTASGDLSTIVRLGSMISLDQLLAGAVKK